VLSVLMLHHLVVWEQALAEAVRVLRLGGLIVVADLLASARCACCTRPKGPTIAC
jgi:hypothetical protein